MTNRPRPKSQAILLMSLLTSARHKQESEWSFPPPFAPPVSCSIVFFVYFPCKDSLLLEFSYSFDCTKDVNWWCHDIKPSPFMDWMATISARTELLLLNPLWMMMVSAPPPPPTHPTAASVVGFSFLFFLVILFSGGARWLQLSDVWKPPLTKSTILHVLPTLKLHLAWWQTFKGLE